MKDLEELLRNTKPHRTSLNFSERVMQDVTEKASLEEAFLQEALTGLKPAKAPASLGNRVMHTLLRPTPSLVDNKARVYIAAACAAFALLVYFAPEHSTYRFHFPDFPSVQVPAICAIAVLGCSALLLLDQWLRKKLH